MRNDILTASGWYVDFLAPDPDSITIEAIAHALGNTCRFGGHCLPFYSVAEHCVRVAACNFVPSWLKFDALMHDAAEAFVGDVPSPLKRLLPDFKTVERRIEEVIADKFDCHEIHHEIVKRADLILLATEQRDLMPAHDDEWPVLKGVPCLETHIRPMRPHIAKQAFLRAFARYAPLDQVQTSKEGIAA